MAFLKIYLFIHCVYVPNDSLVGIFFFLFREGGNREQGRGVAQKGGLKSGTSDFESQTGSQAICTGSKVSVLGLLEFIDFLFFLKLPAVQ